MQLTNEEIAKVFAMYLDCECKEDYSGKEKGTLVSVYRNGYCGVLHKVIWKVACNETTLLLKPLSSITDEDAMSVGLMCVGRDKPALLDHAGKKYIDRLYFPEKTLGRNVENPMLFVNINQYLISRSYAVPLFFAPNHWANGKTAIELGIAIDPQ